MTTIYIEEVDNVDSGEIVKTIFDREDTALAEAGTDILNAIRDNWDLNDDDLRSHAHEIQDFIRSSSYRDAISEYNYHEERRSSNYPVFISVRSETVKSQAARQIYIDFSEYETDEDDEEEEDDDDDSNSIVVSAPYIASSPGATCRGPCRNPSPDAYADQRDGTYVCYQCKLFGGVFGKP